MSDQIIAETVEEWKPVPGYEGLYMASSHGRVRSLHVSQKFGANRILEPSADRDGYQKVGLTNATSWRRSMMLHRVIAAAFIGPCPEGMEVNHKDGNKWNNAAGNLEYVTHRYNVQHCTRVLKHRIGSEHGRAVLHENDIPRIRHHISLGHSTKYIAGLFGVSRGAIANIRNGKCWRHVA